MTEAFLAVVKQDCPTCRLVQPALREIDRQQDLVVYTQDDPAWTRGLSDVRHDATLKRSHKLGVHTVPTLIHLRGDQEVARIEGWDRERWQRLTGLPELAADLPESRPGCGALNVLPGMPERLALRFGEIELASRRLAVSGFDDPVETAFDQGWSDGLPVVPPTELRVTRMLQGTTRPADQVIGLIPPNLSACTVEKVAVNAVMAGCRPEYLPVVLAAVEAALLPTFAMHGLLCTLHSAGPIVVVNGPITKRIGMNWAGNVLGQGNRANSTIGRALQLVIRNVGGGRPGEIDRAVFGHPGKVGFCFAEDETDPRWTPLHVARGFAQEASTVTLFHGESPRLLTDRVSRTAEELTRSLAMGLWAVTHPKAASDASGGALLVLGPGHYDIFTDAGWGREQIHEALWEALRRSPTEIAAGVDGVPVGVDPASTDGLVDKFLDQNLLLARAGGRGGSHSAIMAGWTAQRYPDEVQPVTKEIDG